MKLPWINRLRQPVPRQPVHSDAIIEPPGVKLFVPPGHFYSPIVDPAQIQAVAGRVFNPERPMPGIDLREAAQLAFIETIRLHAHALPFPDEKSAQTRYYYRNGAFSYGDAATLASMLLALQPKRLVEVGSGYSSALALDVNERWLGGRTTCTFIDPFPELLWSLLSEADRARVTILPHPVQEVSLDVFDALEAGDILFLDTTHVVKTGSDVLYHFETVLPRLKPGVVIHIHDIPWPFEYPQPWVLDLNLSWNEVYYVRAFLTDNQNYQILFWNDFMTRNHPEIMRAACPAFALDGGSSFWISKR